MGKEAGASPRTPAETRDGFQTSRSERKNKKNKKMRGFAPAKTVGAEILLFVDRWWTTSFFESFDRKRKVAPRPGYVSNHVLRAIAGVPSRSGSGIVCML
jgi:hypothetical protein